MKNTILNFTKEELDEFIVSDYFSKEIDIWTLFDTQTDIMDYIDGYQITDDDKLERISLELYQNEDYWDILLQLNDRNPLFEMPYNLDVMSLSAEDFILKYSNLIYFNAPLNNTRALELIDEWIEVMKVNNEIYRFIYVIKPSKMPSFIKLLKDKGYL